MKHQIPKPISQRLRRLRGKLGRFLLVAGLSRLLAVMVGLVLVDVFIDRVFKMDFAQRLIMLSVMSVIVLAVIVYRLIRPALRRPSDDALILEVEAHNKQLRQSVISAAQLARETGLEQQGISPTMVDATIRHGASMAGQVDFGNAINRQAHRQNLALLLAGAIGLGAIAFGVASNDFWNLWFKRNVLLTNDQWPKDTRLQLVGVEGPELVLPRGEDHQQFVVVDDGSRIKDVEVSIEFDDGSARTHQKMRRTGKLDGREHLLVFRNLSSEFRFRAKGGDDVTDWVQVRLVEPPGWSELTMTVQLPEYTGIDREPLPRGTGPHAILEGSALSIEATANKPLSDAKLTHNGQSWPMENLGQQRYRLHLETNELVGGKYSFDLADAAGLRSSRPATFSLKIKPDRPPNVRATLLGISGQVVPRARIPVSFVATDEFSITRAEFTHLWKADNADSVPQEGTLDLGQVENQIGNSEMRSVQVLDLEPLGVPIGVGLRIAVQATDNNTLTGPGVGKSREFLLRVVSEEELREDLLRREIEQRKAFELALQHQEELTVEVKALAANLADTGADATTVQEKLEADMLGWQRSQKQIGTNISKIADRFEEFLVEVKNNRLDEAEKEIGSAQSIESRFTQRIIDPIRQLDQTDIILASQNLEACRRSVAGGSTLLDDLITTSETQDQIIQAMQKILSAMEDSETYQEVVNKVIEIKRSEEKIRELTRDKQKATGLDGIFDKPGGAEKSDDGSQKRKSGGQSANDRNGN